MGRIWIGLVCLVCLVLAGCSEKTPKKASQMSGEQTVDMGMDKGQTVQVAPSLGAAPAKTKEPSKTSDMSQALRQKAKLAAENALVAVPKAMQEGKRVLALEEDRTVQDAEILSVSKMYKDIVDQMRGFDGMAKPPYPSCKHYVDSARSLWGFQYTALKKHRNGVEVLQFNTNSIKDLRERVRNYEDACQHELEQK